MEVAFNKALEEMWMAGLYPNDMELLVPVDTFKKFCEFTEISNNGDALIYDSDFGKIRIRIKNATTDSGR